MIEGLELKAVIGVHAWERAFAQRLTLDLVLTLDTAPAAASDALADAVDYAELAQRLQAVAEASEFQLIEALAEALAAAVLKIDQVEQLRLTLWKPGALPAARNVGVRITRGQGDACSARI